MVGLQGQRLQLQALADPAAERKPARTNVTHTMPRSTAWKASACALSEPCGSELGAVAVVELEVDVSAAGARGRVTEG